MNTSSLADCWGAGGWETRYAPARTRQGYSCVERFQGFLAGRSVHAGHDACRRDRAAELLL